MSLNEYFFNNQFSRFFKWLWILVFAGIISFTLFVFMVSWGWFGDLPSLEELENPKTYLASEVYAEDGVLLGKYYLQNRSNTTFDELGHNLVNALIATEDVRFYDHSGIDFRRFTSAVLAVLLTSLIRLLMQRQKLMASFV